MPHAQRQTISFGPVLLSDSNPDGLWNELVSKACCTFSLNQSGNFGKLQLWEASVRGLGIVFYKTSLTLAMRDTDTLSSDQCDHGNTAQSHSDQAAILPGTPM